jgi:hypothetical protein
MDNTWDKLIKIYFYVCDKFESTLKWECQRMSNNARPDLTDQELITIYLFCIHCYGITQMKVMHRFAKDHLTDWFPNLGSYQAFNNRMNGLSSVFPLLVHGLVKDHLPNSCFLDQSLLDSMPVITCSGKRKGKVATAITDKGFCSTKGIYYYGVKLHLLGFRNPGGMPHPESITITPASVNDLALFKQEWAHLKNRTFFGDKIYINQSFFENLYKNNRSEMLTPVKHPKGTPDTIKKFNRACDELYSKAVSAIRQPVESLFNWIIEKSDIQNASKVRSVKGLNVHMFGRLAAAFISWLF